MNSKLWYRQPASDWLEGLPIGNGVLSGMVMGTSPALRRSRQVHYDSVNGSTKPPFGRPKDGVKFFWRGGRDLNPRPPA